MTFMQYYKELSAKTRMNVLYRASAFAPDCTSEMYQEELKAFKSLYGMSLLLFKEEIESNHHDHIISVKYIQVLEVE